MVSAAIYEECTISTSESGFFEKFVSNKYTGIVIENLKINSENLIDKIIQIIEEIVEENKPKQINHGEIKELKNQKNIFYLKNIPNISPNE